MSEIIVKVGGIEYPTVINERGNQLFMENSLFCHLVDSGQVNMNKLSIDYQHDKFSQREYAEFIIGLGWSVSGFADIKEFQSMEIENPFWEE